MVQCRETRLDNDEREGQGYEPCVMALSPVLNRSALLNPNLMPNAFSMSNRSVSIMPSALSLDLPTSQPKNTGWPALMHLTTADLRFSEVVLTSARQEFERKT